MSALERPLRGTSSSSTTCSRQAPNFESRKKKTVSWGDGDSCATAALSGSTKENSVEIRGDGLTKGAVNLNASFTGLGSIQEQGLDHLRVPSARHAAKVDTGRSQDLAATSSTNSLRKRGDPGIQAGAVRVRTPAKPKRPRPVVTPSVSSGLSPPQSSTELRDNRGSPRNSPRNFLRRGEGTGMQATALKTVALNQPHHNGKPARTTSVSPRRSPSTPRVAVDGSSPSSASPHRRASPPSPHRASSGIALRNVAGGDAEEIESWLNDDDSDIPALSALEPSLLSRSPRGLPPRSPRSPRAIGASYGPPPSPSSASYASSSFTSTDPIIEADERENKAKWRAGKDEEEVSVTAGVQPVSCSRCMGAWC